MKNVAELKPNWETLIEKIVWDSETRRATDHIDMTGNVELLNSNKIKEVEDGGKRRLKMMMMTDAL